MRASRARATVDAPTVEVPNMLALRRPPADEAAPEDRFRGTMQRWTLANGERRAIVCDYEFCADWSVTWRVVAGPTQGQVGRARQFQIQEVRADVFVIWFAHDARRDADGRRRLPPRDAHGLYRRRVRDEARHRDVLHAVTGPPDAGNTRCHASRSHCRAVEAAQPAPPAAPDPPPCSRSSTSIRRPNGGATWSRNSPASRGASSASASTGARGPRTRSTRGAASASAT